jgi:hypothetical protein
LACKRISNGVVICKLLNIMASVKYSSFVDEIKGRVGNAVFQKLGKSFGIRSQVYNRYSDSIKAKQSRYNMSYLATVWASLTVEQVQLWNSIAPSWPAYNRYNQPIDLTGYQLFLQVNLMLLAANIELIRDAQPFVPVDIIGCQFLDCHLSTSTFNLLFDGPAFPNQYQFAYASQEYPCASADRNPKTFFLGQYNDNAVRTINVFDKVDELTPGGLHLKKSLYCEIWNVDPASGSYALSYSAWKTIIT